MKELIVLTLIGLLSSTTLSKEHIITSSNKLSAELGAGYNSEEESFVGNCVTGEPIYVGKQESNLDFSQTISQKQLSKELGIAAGGRARMGAVTYSASAKFLKSSTSNSFSISSIYTGNYSFRQRKLKNPKLNEIGKKLSTHPERFQRTCGDNFSHKQSLGAKIFFSIRLDFTSQKAKQSFEANFSMSGPMASASASLKQAKNTFSKDTKVTITALQIGGDVSKISDIFYSGDGNGSKDFVSCSFGDLEKCENVLSNAIKYATDTRVGFPSQIRPETDMNSPIGPAVLSTHAYSYELMGEYINFSPALTRAIKSTRRNLSALFEDVFSQHNLAYTLINNGTVRLSPQQRNHFVDIETNIYSQMYALAEGIEDCYQSPLECHEVWEEFNSSAPTGIKLYSAEEFKVEKEIFAQWCDFGKTSFATSQTQLTTQVLVEKAMELDPDAFSPPGAGLSVDACYIAGAVLEKQRDLDLSGKGLSDLRPLETLPQLSKLNLSRNLITNVSPLAKLDKLAVLSLSQNSISDLRALGSLLNLSNLELADNEIENTDPLSVLGRVRFLDLRNNGINIACPFKKDGVCLIADYRYNNEFIPLSRNHMRLPSRLGHRVSKLSNGDLIVSGGLSDSNLASTIGILSNFQTEFLEGAELLRQRSFHTSTVLNDDSILLLGGWGSNHSAEIINPNYVSNSKIGSMKFPRVEHVATKLDSGNVLITGGWKGRNQFWTGRDSQATAEIFLVSDRKFVSVGSMRVPRAGHTMTKLSDGRVLIVGGFKVDHESMGEGISSAEIFDPKFNRFIKIKSRLRFGRGHHTAVKLKDGRVLIIGGYTSENKATNRLEIFDPETSSFNLVKEELNEARAYHQSVLLPDGKVFIVGGEREHSPRRNVTDACNTCSKTAEIFDPYSGISTKTTAEMNVPRSQFSATLTNDNRVIIIGGKGNGARFSASMFEFSEF